MTDRDVQQYVDWFESLTLGSLEDIASIMTDDVHFSDPFNSVFGLSATRKVFEDMFEMLDSPRFHITHSAMSATSPAVALMRWEMTAKNRKNGQPVNIVGMSEIHFSGDGRVKLHIDHWDAGRQFYEKLPIIGWLVKRIRSRMAA